MTKEQFKELDTKLLAYEWIVDYPSGAYEFILELIKENEYLKEQLQLAVESNKMAAKLLDLKYKKV